MMSNEEDTKHKGHKAIQIVPCEILLIDKLNQTKSVFFFFHCSLQNDRSTITHEQIKNSCQMTHNY